MKLTPEDQRLVDDLHAAWQAHRDEARAAETSIRQARTPEARDAAVKAAESLLLWWKTGGRIGAELDPDRIPMRVEAEDMRRSGFSYSEIANALDIPRPTIQRWTQNIPKGSADA